MAQTLIKSVQIIDGTGKPPFSGDILIKDGRISAIGNFPNKKADKMVDGLGLTALPGLIDIHNTSDHYLGLFTNPEQKDFLLQGVTTIVGGYCGSSLAPLMYGSLKSIRKWADTDGVNVDWGSVSELKAVLRRLGLGVNFATLAGHSTIRRDLLGDEIRDLTVSEMEVFKNALAGALRDGALGFSTGLSYAHSRNVPYQEIKELAKTAKASGGVYAAHLRSERDELAESVLETIKIAEETGAASIISHLRPIIGFENQFQEALELINKNLDKANIYFEINPFAVSILPLYTILPVWAQNRSLEDMLSVITDANQRLKILEEFKKSGENFSSMIIAEARDNPYITGKTLKEFSDSRGLDLFEGILILMEITKMKALLFYKNINPELLSAALFHPRSLIGSNSASLKESGSYFKSGRTADTFPQYFNAVLSKGVSWEEAVKKVTSVPAKILGLSKRGEIKEGWFADLVLMKNGLVSAVLVNGEMAVENRNLTGKRAGSPL